MPMDRAFSASPLAVRPSVSLALRISSAAWPSRPRSNGSTTPSIRGSAVTRRQPPACDNCYAAAMSASPRWAASSLGAPAAAHSDWRTGGEPLRWNRKAEAAGARAKVFGPSLADPFDAEVSPDWREDYLRLIEATPSSRLDPADQAAAGGAQVLRRPQGARQSLARHHRREPDHARPARATSAGDRRQGPRGVSRAAAGAARSLRYRRRDWAGSSPAARADRGRGRPIPTGSARCVRSARPPASRCSSSSGASTART